MARDTRNTRSRIERQVGGDAQREAKFAAIIRCGSVRSTVAASERNFDQQLFGIAGFNPIRSADGRRVRCWLRRLAELRSVRLAQQSQHAISMFDANRQLNEFATLLC